MSGWARRAVAVSVAAGLAFGVAKQTSNAQDIVPIWPTMDQPLAASAPAAVPRDIAPSAPSQPVAPIKAAVSIPSALPPATLHAAAPQSADARLDQLVAPIALYPDPLLGQVLMAATYPQEIAEAARWVRVPANRALGSGALLVVLRTKGWNASVMALVPFPGLLATMADKLDWTGQLGNAFLAHQGDVMAAVQRLRHAALAAGSLKATPECHCVIQTSGDIISIQPANAELVAVPVYNPAVVYGAWADPAHPPAVFPLPAGSAALGNAVGFGAAIEVALFGPVWGWDSIDWPNRRIVVDNRRYAALLPGHATFAGGVWAREAPSPHRLAGGAASLATHAAHHAKPGGNRRFAAMHPPPSYPPYWWSPRDRAWGLPPGTIVPPPPYHAFRDWRDGYFDPYR